MTDLAKLRQLKKIADLLRDRDLAALARVSAQKSQTEALLTALDKTQPFTGVDLVLAAQLEDRYGLWATNRRIQLNQQLARTTAAWMTARGHAQTSFGRANVLGKLDRRN